MALLCFGIGFGSTDRNSQLKPENQMSGFAGIREHEDTDNEITAPLDTQQYISTRGAHKANEDLNAVYHFITAGGFLD